MSEQSNTVLLIEDNPDDVWAFRRAFREIGWPSPLHVVEGGAQALEYLEGKGKYHNRHEFPLPTLVLVDLKMPGMDGFEVLKWIRAQPELSNLRVVVLTTSDEIRDVNRAYTLGANSFLTKPLNLPEFRNMLDAFITHWIKHSRAPHPARKQETSR